MIDTAFYSPSGELTGVTDKGAQRSKGRPFGFLISPTDPHSLNNDKESSVG